MLISPKHLISYTILVLKGFHCKVFKNYSSFLPYCSTRKFCDWNDVILNRLWSHQIFGKCRSSGGTNHRPTFFLLRRYKHSRKKEAERGGDIQFKTGGPQERESPRPTLRQRTTIRYSPGGVAGRAKTSVVVFLLSPSTRSVTLASG